jgi:uncharacterized protein (DUF427 family)
MVGQQRIEPQPGQESVWDYPRPPRVEDSHKHIQVIFNGVVIADSTRAKRVLETSHPPVYYIPAEDVRLQEYGVPEQRSTWCEWKGQAAYYTLAVGGKTSHSAAWYYPRPTPGYASIRDHIAFYPGRVDACLVDDEPVTPQPGDFYGGWITRDIVGPFKRG